MKKTYKIKGMHCASCEVLIERNFKHISGVHSVHVDHITGKADIEAEHEPSLTDLTNAIKDAGYSVSNWTQRDEVSEEDKKLNRKDYEDIGAILLIVLGVYFIAKLLNILPDVSLDDSVTYGVAFTVGLIAALSTCMATAGGLLLGISTKYNQAYGTHATKLQRFRPHIYFNAGRIISYTLLGGLLGVLGSSFTLSTKTTGIFTVIISIIMVVLGLQLLNIIPKKYAVGLPKSWTKKLYDSSTATGKASPFLFGALTFFLPCGFTQALQLYVLTQGSFSIGALTMLSFSLGTLPALLSLGMLSSFTKGAFQTYLPKFAGVIVILVGLISISSGFVLTGFSPSFLPQDVQEIGSGAPVVNGNQIVEMKVTGLDYYPDSFTLKKGVPVEWRIDGKGAQGCAGVIAVPNLGITQRLSKSETTVITFTPSKTGKIKFSCGMGMAGPGTFNVV